MQSRRRSVRHLSVLLAAAVSAVCAGNAGDPDQSAPPEGAADGPPVVASASEPATAPASDAVEGGGDVPAPGGSGEPSPGGSGEGELLVAPEATPQPVVTYGVPECDNYVKKYLTCIETHVPADQRHGWLATFEANRARWKSLWSMREGKLALGLACKSALEMSRQALVVDFGCEF